MAATASAYLAGSKLNESYFSVDPGSIAHRETAVTDHKCRNYIVPQGVLLVYKAWQLYNDTSTLDIIYLPLLSPHGCPVKALRTGGLAYPINHTELGSPHIFVCNSFPKPFTLQRVPSQKHIWRIPGRRKLFCIFWIIQVPPDFPLKQRKV